MSNCFALIGKKAGMSSIYDELGNVTPVTVVEVGESAFLGIKTSEKDGYNAAVIGAFKTNKENKVNKPQKSLFNKCGLGLFRKVKEFRFPASIAKLSSISPVSFKISDNIKGAFVDVQGVSSGKGFQGPMKRWGFKGLRASHGVSLSHRSHGSTGNRTDPGKVFKGKKMAGHMGAGVVVQQNVFVLDVDAEDGLLFLRGSVPGKKGSTLFIRDSVRKRPSVSEVDSLNGFAKSSSSTPSNGVDSLGINADGA